MDKRTLKWYNENADSYTENTRNFPVLDALGEFLFLLPEKGRILDYGCGSGRDSLYFLNKGYSVDALDGSERMAKEAEDLTGLNVKCQDFLFLNETSFYDGVWAQASLLHLTFSEIQRALSLVEHALKSNGIFYLSFRYGDKEEREGERFYTNMTEEKLNKILPKNLSLVKTWKSLDSRPNQYHTWINFLLKKN